MWHTDTQLHIGEVPVSLMDGVAGRGPARRWEQKQVQIKTMEGEFSVTMWATGEDDGEEPHTVLYYQLFFFLLPCSK
ncbi:hypothetical protein B5X24_HaOG216558 [Helicoverpa armigera]|uniref:Uncharacterized protein n=1 Tax=Helicoverpa armigera TaxID=29058 RepID=A0A2W1B1U3_HELAM|nr:hypothetical protein B5X24_HaOG216558 [Helicoverpa armigera]